MKMTGKALKKWRLSLGLTQTALAKEMGWDQSLVAHYESGRHKISVDKIKSLQNYARAEKINPPTVRE